MSEMSRRAALKLLATAPLIGTLEWTPEEVSAAALRVQELPAADLYEPKFFTPHEWETLRILVDLIIPRDAKSGGATDAAVPEFMDFMMLDGSEGRRTSMRAGLEWLDEEAQFRYRTTFAGARDAQRREILDDVAWPARAPVALAARATWFTSVRDLTASGFFSSKLGFDDLEYKGNQFVREWNGCPPAALNKLGVSYNLMEKR